MFQIFRFFSDNRVIILFLLMEFVAFISILNTNSFHQSNYITSANNISGYILKKSNDIQSFFRLKEANYDLKKENLDLKNQLEKLKELQIPPTVNQIDTLRKYTFITANVISNSYLKKDNIITLDKGAVDGVEPNMGVVLSNGIVGITLDVSKHYCTVMSILNSKMSINVKLKKNHHFGSMQWDGKTFSKVQLLDIPIQANIKEGDTIVTGGLSVFFPEQIPIGTISKVKIINKSFEKIDIKLFADFSAIHTVYIVKNKFRDEQLELEKKSNVENE